jgi:hypothetical protein
MPPTPPSPESIKAALKDLLKLDEQRIDIQKNYTEEIEKQLINFKKIKEIAKELNIQASIQKKLKEIEPTREKQISLLQESTFKRALRINELREYKASRAAELAILNSITVPLTAAQNLRIRRLNTILGLYNANINKQKIITDEESKRLKILQVQELFYEKLPVYAQALSDKLNLIGSKIPLLTPTSIFGFFKMFDAAAFEFRKTMGLTNATSQQMRDTVEKVAVEYARLGVTVESGYKAVSAITKELGSSYSVSEDLVKNVGMMSAQFGISEEKSAKVLKNMAALSGTTVNSQRNMLGFVQKLSEASGTQLPDVMNDIEHASSTVYTMIGRSGLALIKAAVEARRMGTTLESMAKTSRGLLDFQSSIDAEMEASVLAGRSINFQRARELAYHKNIIGANKEILRLAKEVRFEQMDPFQQDAFSKAAGKTVEELNKMLQSEKDLQLSEDYARKINDKDALKRIADRKKLLKLQEDESKNVGKMAFERFKMESNQSEMLKLQNEWNSLMLELAREYMPMIISGIRTIHKFLSDPYNREYLKVLIGSVFYLGIASKTILFMDKTFKAIRITVKAISGLLSFIPWGSIWDGMIIKSLRMWQGIKNGFSSLWNWLKNLPWGAIWNTMKTKFSSILQFIRNGFSSLWNWLKNLPWGAIWNTMKTKTLQFFNWVRPFLGSAIRLVGRGLLALVTSTIGSVITALAGGFGIGTLINKLFDKIGFTDVLQKYIFEPLQRMLPSIVDGIASAYEGLVNFLKHPFETFKKWFYKDSGLPGHSKSVIGESIIEGIRASNKDIYTSLVSPFDKSYPHITNRLKSISDRAKLEFKEMDASPAITVEHKNRQEAMSVDTVKRKIEIEQKDTIDMLSNLLSSINGLRKDMSDGKITIPVYLDTQLVGLTMARNTAWRDGFGVNKASSARK